MTKPVSPSPSRSALAPRVALAWALAVATFALYLPALKGEFVDLDDNTYVYDNPRVAAGWNGETARWLVTAVVGGNWHPLTVASHVTDVSLWGLDPWGHHLTNLVLHAVNAALVFLVLSSATGAVWRSLAAAVIFAWHPLRVESVAWIAERKDVLSGLGWLLAWWAYGWYAARPSAVRMGVVAVGMALGLLAKPMVVTFPCALLLWDYWPLGRLPDPRDSATGPWWPRFGRLVAEKLPLFALALAASAITYAAQAAEGVRSLATLGFSLRVLNAGMAYVDYLWQTVWPVGLAVFYPHPAQRLPWGLATGAVVALLAITVGLARHARERPYALVGWLWFLGTLVPTIGLVQVGGAARADRYTYLPSIGLAVAVVWWVADGAAASRARRLGATAASIAVAAALAVSTQRQIAVWHDSESLFRHAAQVTVDNYVALSGWGDALAEQGDWSTAAEKYAAAVAAFPTYDRAVRGLVRAEQQSGHLDRAAEVYVTAVRGGLSSPADVLACAEMLREVERLDEARELLQGLLLHNPVDAAALTGMGRVEARAGRPGRAEQFWRQAVAADPNRADAALDLAWFWATYPQSTVRNGREALRLATQLSQGPAAEAWRTWDTLAAARAETGDFAGALTALAEALTRAESEAATGSPSWTPAHDPRELLAERARLYRRGIAYREPERPARRRPLVPAVNDQPPPTQAPGE